MCLIYVILFNSQKPVRYLNPALFCYKGNCILKGSNNLPRLIQFTELYFGSRYASRKIFPFNQRLLIWVPRSLCPSMVFKNCGPFHSIRFRINQSYYAGSRFRVPNLTVLSTLVLHYPSTILKIPVTLDVQ